MGNFHKESRRIKTFNRQNTISTIDRVFHHTLELAALGFYMTKDGTVKCYACKLELHSISFTDKVFQIHSKLAPHCEIFDSKRSRNKVCNQSTIETICQVGVLPIIHYQQYDERFSTFTSTYTVYGMAERLAVEGWIQYGGKYMCYACRTILPTNLSMSTTNFHILSNAACPHLHTLYDADTLLRIQRSLEFNKRTDTSLQANENTRIIKFVESNV